LPQNPALLKESEVKAVAHSVQLAVEDFKMNPGKEGIKPVKVRDLLALLPKAIIEKPNPFNPKQTYSSTGGGLVDGHPKEPGQVGYIYTGQDKPYLIQALGDSGRVILTLGEGE
jgi:hypothetical protein